MNGTKNTKPWLRKIKAVCGCCGKTFEHTYGTRRYYCSTGCYKALRRTT